MGVVVCNMDFDHHPLIWEYRGVRDRFLCDEPAGLLAAKHTMASCASNIVYGGSGGQQGLGCRSTPQRAPAHNKQVVHWNIGSLGIFCWALRDLHPPFWMQLAPRSAPAAIAPPELPKW